MKVALVRKWLPRVGLTVLVAIVAAAAIFLVWRLSIQDAAYVERAAEASQEYRDQANGKIAACERRTPVEVKQCTDDADNTYEQQNREERNVAAQEVSARWTKIAGIAAILAGVVVSGLGTILLLLTFWQTRKTSRSELRAYVFPDTVTLFEGNAETLRDDLRPVPNVHIVIKNFGKTPARNVKHIATMILAPNDSSFEVPPFPSLDHFSTTTMPPGHTQISQYVLSGEAFSSDWRTCLTPLGADAIRAGTHVFLAYGLIEYRDVFGRPHRTEYRFFYTNHWPMGDGGTGMRFANKGNRDS